MAATELGVPQVGAPREATRALGDRRLAAGAALALVLANGRYWTSVAPIVRGELARWRLRAGAIEDRQLRELALCKLESEGFHAEAAAMLATGAPRAHRRSVVEAIVALEVLFDYLDGLTELACPDPLREGERLFATLTDAVSVPSDDASELAEPPLCRDGGYLDELALAVRQAVARLPATPAISGVARRIASLSGAAQTRMHAASSLGVGQLEEWARGQAHDNELGWREFVAGCASSILVLHALIAAAADRHTSSQDAAQIEEAYRSTCVVLTLLDGLIDHERDNADDGANRPGYLSLFEDRDEFSQTVGQAAARAAKQARELPDGAHHMMLLAGVVAYYASEPGAEGELASPVVARLRRELGPLMAATLGVMRAWRRTRSRPATESKRKGRETP